LRVTTVSSSGQSARELASDIAHLTSAMTSARLTVLGRAHFHSLTPLCHSLPANPWFPPFISISHPSITHHILSLSLSPLLTFLPFL
ncbi:Pol polyprotein, partial [Clarias magur]